MIRRILNLNSVGKPQFIAALLLLVYLGQCAWLVYVQTKHGVLPDPAHALRVSRGLEEWKGDVVAGTAQSLKPAELTGVPSAASNGSLRVRDGYDRDRSPLYYLVAGAPWLVAPAALPADSTVGQLWGSAPYFFFGVMLGGSLWYVTRRLYGNSGGYIALVLYCFSPAIILNTAGAQSAAEMGAVWGAFGSVFTAIAVAHTLYAPREVVLWNWRRILLLGLSFVLALGDQFSLAVLVLTSLLLMFWVAPIRKRAALVIWAAALAFAFAVFLIVYLFRPAVLGESFSRAAWVDFQPRAFTLGFSWQSTALNLFRGSPPLLFLLPVALLIYAGWKRSRYFGNTAPLLIAALMLVLAMGAPTFPGEGFHLTALVFLFVFAAGVFADMLETLNRYPVIACLVGLLGAGAIWNVLQLVRAAKS